jgi:hypothetical protein
MDGQLALLFSMVASRHESRSALPDAPTMDPGPDRRERRAARVRARAAAKAVRSAERVVRASRPRPAAPATRQAGTQPTDPTALWW